MRSLLGVSESAGSLSSVFVHHALLLDLYIQTYRDLAMFIWHEMDSGLYLQTMTRRVDARFGVLALLAALGSSCLASAQSQVRVDCHPRAPSTTEGIKIIVTDVEFRGENPLPDSVRAQLVSDIQQLNLNVALAEADAGWLGEVERPIREAIRKLGYFRVLLTTTPYLVLAESRERHYVVSVEIESGPQYRLGELRVSGTRVFPADQLRDQFLLQHGELFDVPKIRQGLESIAKLYGSKGYIDATPEPDTTIDEKNGTIDVVIKVDEEKQYRVRMVETHGLALEAERLLKSRLEPGQVFDSVAFWKFFDEHKAALPQDVMLDDAIQVRRDISSATVDLTVDLRHCPES